MLVNIKDFKYEHRNGAAANIGYLLIKIILHRSFYKRLSCYRYEYACNISAFLTNKVSGNMAVLCYECEAYTGSSSP